MEEIKARETPRQWFDRVDINHSGYMSAPQLQSALAVGNLQLTLSIVEQMISVFL